MIGAVVLACQRAAPPIHGLAALNDAYRAGQHFLYFTRSYTTQLVAAERLPSLQPMPRGARQIRMPAVRLASLHGPGSAGHGSSPNRCGSEIIMTSNVATITRIRPRTPELRWVIFQDPLTRQGLLYRLELSGALPRDHGDVGLDLQ